MLDGALTIDFGTSGSRLIPVMRDQTALPVDALLIDRAPEDVAALLPRIFNLCAEAQGMAARLALGLALDDDADDRLRAEILREHVMRICVLWPRSLGWMDVGSGVQPRLDRDLKPALFGPTGGVPASLGGFNDWIRSGEGAAPALLRLVQTTFAPDEATVDALDPITLSTAWTGTPVENAPAMRQQAHPLMRVIEDSFGRGPMWRVLARIVEAEALLDGWRPKWHLHPDGTAEVPAARGQYFVCAEVTDGCVTRFSRRTPTDHARLSGGVLEQSLASLPFDKKHLAHAVVGILDPCVPVRMGEVANA